MRTMPNWALLNDAYGTAEDVPGLLTRAEGSDRALEWDELWGRLCHQGTVYSASYAALPQLAVMAKRHEPEGLSAPVYLAASIIASTDGPVDPRVVRAEHAGVLADLRDIAERNLSEQRMTSISFMASRLSWRSRTAECGSAISTLWPTARCPWNARLPRATGPRPGRGSWRALQRDGCLGGRNHSVPRCATASDSRGPTSAPVAAQRAPCRRGEAVPSLRTRQLSSLRSELRSGLSAVLTA